MSNVAPKYASRSTPASTSQQRSGTTKNGHEIGLSFRTPSPATTVIQATLSDAMLPPPAPESATADGLITIEPAAFS